MESSNLGGLEMPTLLTGMAIRLAALFLACLVSLAFALKVMDVKTGQLQGLFELIVKPQTRLSTIARALPQFSSWGESNRDVPPLPCPPTRRPNRSCLKQQSKNFLQFIIADDVPDCPENEEEDPFSLDDRAWREPFGLGRKHKAQEKFEIDLDTSVKSADECEPQSTSVSD